MIHAIIIDDEQLACETLAAMIEHYFNEKVKIIATANSVKDGVVEITKHNPDLVFLDIEMPNENGLKLFNYFQYVPFEVIFTTAHKQFAIDALKRSAVDYMLKPVNFIDLQQALNRYEKKKSTNQGPENIWTTKNQLNFSNGSNIKIAFPTLNGYQLEKVSSIIYCEADQNYTKIFTINGDSFLVSKSIGFIEDLLPNDIFFRIHKSYLVNLHFIKSYSRTDGFQIALENGTILDVASRRNQEFLKALTGK